MDGHDGPSPELAHLMTVTAMTKLSPVLLVDRIERCLPFWTERLGFEKTVEVPEGDALGFVILVKDDVEIMYQSWASIRKDMPALAAGRAPATDTMALFIEVADVDEVERSLRESGGVEVVLPRRKTFYGMDEIGVREPGGHFVVFAQNTTTT